MGKKASLFRSIPDSELLGFGLLSFQNHFHPMISKTKLMATQKKQIELILKINDDIDKDEFESMDYVDIVNTETGGIVFQYYLYPEGSGKLFLNGTDTVFAEILQHGFEFAENPGTMKEMITAYRLLLDLDFADKRKDFVFNQFTEKFSAADFASNLKKKGIDIAKDRDFIKYEKDMEKRGLLFVPTRSRGKVILDLSERNLKKIPQQLFLITDLTDLNLGFNEITEIPAEIGNLTDLQSLIINHNQISNIPPEIGRLKNLTTLNLTGGKFSSLPDEFYELTQLETLILSGVKLESFSDRISRFTKLKKLIMNGSVTLPRNISKIPNLNELEMMNCGMTEVPEEIFRLKSLTFLNLNQNAIVRLPSEIGNLDNLKRLSIGENQLEKLPPELYRLNKLKDLYLYRNKLTTLDEEICGLESLERIHFGDNKIEHLPKSIGKMKNLKEIEQIWTFKFRNVPKTINEKGLDAVKKHLCEQ